jgi:hypothetical protein
MAAVTEPKRWARLDPGGVVIAINVAVFEEDDPMLAPAPGGPYWVEAPDEVAEGWVYDREAQTWTEPQWLRTRRELERLLDAAVPENTAFMAITNPSQPQSNTQVRNLTTQVQNLIRLVRELFESTS